MSSSGFFRPSWSECELIVWELSQRSKSRNIVTLHQSYPLNVHRQCITNQDYIRLCVLHLFSWLENIYFLLESKEVHFVNYLWYQPTCPPWIPQSRHANSNSGREAARIPAISGIFPMLNSLKSFPFEFLFYYQTLGKKNCSKTNFLFFHLRSNQTATTISICITTITREWRKITMDDESRTTWKNPSIIVHTLTNSFHYLLKQHHSLELRQQVLLWKSKLCHYVHNKIGYTNL